MLLEIAQAIVADVKARHSDGDCPITRQHTVENLEDALLTLVAAPPVPAPAPADGANWRDDPSADERWNAGCDFAMTQICKYLGVEPSAVSWDAATETLDGDVSSVLGNILRAHFGEDWSPSTPPAARSEPAAAAMVEKDSLKAKLIEAMLPHIKDTMTNGQAIARIENVFAALTPEAPGAQEADRG